MKKSGKLNNHIKYFLTTKFFAYAQAAFFSIFINIYLWRLTNDISILVLYNIIFALFHLLATFPAGKIAKEYNRFIPLRLGLIVQLIFLGTILFVSGDIVHYLIPIAMIGGVGHGLYWASDDILKLDLTNPLNRLKFTSSFEILKIIAKAVIPLIASYLIVRNGEVISSYSLIFLLAFLITAASLIFSFFISSVKSFSSQSYNPRPVFLKILKERNMRYVLSSSLLGSISETLPIFLSLVLFILTGTELSIGGFQFLTILSVGANYFVGKFFRRKHYKKLLIFGGILNFALIFILFIRQDFTSILIYGVLSSIFSTLNNCKHPIGMDVINNFVKDKKELFNIRIECINLIEMFDVIGKIISFCILALLTISMNFYAIALVAVLLASGKLLSNFSLTRVKTKRFVNIDKLN